jgi:hypothetical protein
VDRIRQRRNTEPIKEFLNIFSSRRLVAVAWGITPRSEN